MTKRFYASAEELRNTFATFLLKGRYREQLNDGPSPICSHGNVDLRVTLHVRNTMVQCPVFDSCAKMTLARHQEKVSIPEYPKHH